MKKISANSAKAVLGTLAVAALFVTGNASAASDGTATLNFLGALTAVTCAVTSGTGANNTTTLPTMPISSLALANAVAGKTPFTIVVSGCTGNNASGVPIAAAMPYFDITSSTIDQTTNNLKNTSGAASVATNVELQILDGGTNAPVLLGAAWAGGNGVTSGLPTASAGQKVTKQTLSPSGGATFPFYVQYYATDTTTAGQVASSVPVFMQYE